MSRFARDYQVVFFEEPEYVEASQVGLAMRTEACGVTVVVPRVEREHALAQQRALLDACLRTLDAQPRVLWYYTPMSLDYSGHLRAERIVYDCMDELSAFRFCPPQLVERERQLLARADVVFTGGMSLYESKRRHHPNVHGCPSSVDIAHFAQARQVLPEPADLAGITPGPRLGFFGVIDERFDVDLLAQLAAARPHWQFILIGPVVKIDPATVPTLPNVHLLGGKRYDELPAYLAHWDVALMPFAMNESTRFISPTKTPEYLAGGRPVVSTPIADVVREYGDCPAVRIASDAAGFVSAIEAALQDRLDRARLWAVADAKLRPMSWDRTWQTMKRELSIALEPA
jgi:glycosyltransferase involved in cell wall biosynthesis